MQKIVVEGGVPLRGEVRISGAKNAVLPILCAALLADGDLVVRNVPNLHDVKTTLRLLAELGCGITLDDSFTIRIDPSRITSHVAPYELVKTMRASVLVLGPLLAKFGAAEVSLPGGCAIGSRPVDQHIKGMQALGAEVAVEHGFIKASAKRLRGARVVFDMVSVGATENVLMAATLAEGRTVLENAAKEPEIVDLAECLVMMGAKIEGAGSDRIVVEGVERLSGGEHPVVADRIEAGTFLVAAAMTGGTITATHARPDTMGVILDKLRDAGANLECEDDRIHLDMRGRPRMSRWMRSSSHSRFAPASRSLSRITPIVSGRAWVAVIVPPVIAAATRNVPASMRSATTGCSPPLSRSTPSTTIRSLPAPSIFAPIITRHSARSTISGSFAAFSSTVRPSARVAAISTFSVAPTLTMSNTTRAPRRRFALALMKPCSTATSAPRACMPLMCWSTGREPIAQPPGNETSAAPNLASKGPSTSTEARMVFTSS